MKFSKDQNILVLSVSESKEWEEPRIGIFKSYTSDLYFCKIWFPGSNSVQPISVYSIFPDTQKMREIIYQLRCQHEVVRREQKELFSMFVQARNAVTRGEV